MFIENTRVSLREKMGYYVPLANGKQENSNPIHCFYYVMILFTACIIVYWPTFNNQFQFKWDDWWVVMNQYTEGGINVENIGRIFTEFYHGQYAPVNELFYLLLFSISGGYDAFVFHTASLTVHVCNVFLVFFLIRRLLLWKGHFPKSSVFQISFFTALLMAVHPIQVEAVAWMSASKCILYTFFYLLALHCYLTYLKTRKIGYYLLLILLFFTSFGSKEQAVTLPICLLLFDFVLKRNLKSLIVWKEKFPLICLSCCFAVFTFYSQAYNGEGLLSDQTNYPWYQNVIFAAYSVTEYFIKSVLPIKLHYLYPFPNQVGEPVPYHLWVYPAMLVILTIALIKLSRDTWIFFGFAFFLITISVASNIIPTSRYAIIADRYVYLPATGVEFLIAYFVVSLIKKKEKYKTLISILFFIYILLIGIYAYSRCQVWYDSTSLKRELNDVLKNRNDFEEQKARQKLKKNKYFQ